MKHRGLQVIINYTLYFLHNTISKNQLITATLFLGEIEEGIANNESEITNTYKLFKKYKHNQK